MELPRTSSHAVGECATRLASRRSSGREEFLRGQEILLGVLGNNQQIRVVDTDGIICESLRISNISSTRRAMRSQQTRRSPIDQKKNLQQRVVGSRESNTTSIAILGEPRQQSESWRGGISSGTACRAKVNSSTGIGVKR